MSEVFRRKTFFNHHVPHLAVTIEGAELAFSPVLVAGLELVENLAELLVPGGPGGGEESVEHPADGDSASVLHLPGP